MEKVENINIQFSGDKFPENPIVIHLLEGPAPTPFRTIDPVKKRIEGDINSVKEFIKNNLLKADKAVVYYSDNPANPWIELQVNPEDELAPVVKGVLSPNPDLKAFFFNEKAAFKNDTFIDVIKKYAHCFKSKEEAKVLIKTLTNFKAKFST